MQNKSRDEHLSIKYTSILCRNFTFHHSPEVPMGQVQGHDPGSKPLSNQIVGNRQGNRSTNEISLYVLIRLNSRHSPFWAGVFDSCQTFSRKLWCNTQWNHNYHHNRYCSSRSIITSCFRGDLLAEMAKVNICNVVVLDNPSPFRNPFQFEITFECLEDLKEGEYLTYTVDCKHG